MTELLRFPIGRDVRASIVLTGRVTQEGIQKLIELLECERDTFPEEERPEPTGDPDPLAPLQGDAIIARESRDGRAE